jgi:hypothetical protein
MPGAGAFVAQQACQAVHCYDDLPYWALLVLTFAYGGLLVWIVTDELLCWRRRERQ